jgi:hypothetical protein
MKFTMALVELVASILKTEEEGTAGLSGMLM